MSTRSARTPAARRGIDRAAAEPRSSPARARLFRITAAVLLAVGLTLSLPAALRAQEPLPGGDDPAPAGRQVVFTTRYTSGLYLSRAENFDLKAQPSDELSLGLGMRLFERRVKLGFTAGAHYVRESDTRGGYLYRAFWGAELGLRAAAHRLLYHSGEAGETAGGVALEAGGRFSQYRYTRLLFFQPFIGLEPYLEFAADHRRRLAFRLSAPLRRYDNPDLERSWSGGLSLGVLIRSR